MEALVVVVTVVVVVVIIIIIIIIITLLPQSIGRHGEENQRISMANIEYCSIYLLLTPFSMLTPSVGSSQHFRAFYITTPHIYIILYVTLLDRVEFCVLWARTAMIKYPAFVFMAPLSRIHSFP